MSVQVKLTDGSMTVIDERDLPLVEGCKLFRHTRGYVMRLKPGPRAASNLQLLHRIILSAKPGQIVDHINCDKNDNRRSNLRFVDTYQNQQNRKGANRNSRSGIRGVDYIESSGRWRAQITVKYVNNFLGNFSTKEEATAARKAAEVEFWGPHE